MPRTLLFVSPLPSFMASLIRRKSEDGLVLMLFISIRVSIQAVRATLILIPLLGLHYLLIPFRPDPGSKQVEAIYEVVAAATSSLQV